jgi:hypothetical protein
MLNLRLKIADLHSLLRETKQAMDLAEARITGTITGKNAEERKANLTIALATDQEHRTLCYNYEQTTTRLERCEAELEGLKDERREREWTIRARLADALISRGVQSDSDDPTGDGAFDDVGDQVSYDVVFKRPKPRTMRINGIVTENVEIPF